MASGICGFSEISGAPEDVLEATTCYCAPENLRLDVAGKQFVGTESPSQPSNPADQTMRELLDRVPPQKHALETLTKKLNAGEGG